MRGTRPGWTWLRWAVIGGLVLAAGACGVATSAVPTATPGPTATPKPTPEPLELVILYTSHAQGVAEASEPGDD